MDMLTNILKFETKLIKNISDGEYIFLNVMTFIPSS